MVELTPEEREIALTEASRRKSGRLDAAKQAEIETVRLEDDQRKQARMEVANAKSRREWPERWCGLAGLAGVPVVYVPFAVDVRARVVFAAGCRYEHVTEDVDGVWLYRYMSWPPAPVNVRGRAWWRTQWLELRLHCRLGFSGLYRGLVLGRGILATGRPQPPPLRANSWKRVLCSRP